MRYKEVPLRLLLEQRRRQRELLENLDWLASRLAMPEDREFLWKIRTKLLDIMIKDLSMTRGRL